MQFTQHNITNLENRIRTVKEETSTISVTAVERDAALRTVADLAEQVSARVGVRVGVRPFWRSKLEF